MTAEKEFAFRVLEELIKQYFEKKPMAAEKLLAHIAKFPKTFQLINYKYIAITSLELEDAQQIVYMKLLKQLRQQKFYEGNANKFILWARFVAANTIKDFLRWSRETDISADWSLLLKLSTKRFQESLLNEGLSPDTVERYILAWNCFKTIYGVSRYRDRINRELSQLKPDKKTWKAIAQLYNQERKKQLASPDKLITPETIEKWIRFGSQAARSYLYPNVISLNQLNSEYHSGEIIDSLVDEIDDSLTNEMILKEEVQEQEIQKNKINELLTKALKNLDDKEKKILELYYKQGLTQSEIAQQLGTKQYTISRRLSRTRKHLFKVIYQLIEKEFNTIGTSDLFESMAIFIEEWLFKNSRFLEHSNQPD